MTTTSATYRVAGESAKKNENLTAVQMVSEFARCIGELFERHRPRRIIETGTYLGTGTTGIICSTLQRLGINDAAFYSIEVNPAHYRKAVANLAARGHAPRLLNGLSVPRSLLPTREQIEQAYVNDPPPARIFVDHDERKRVDLYYRETDFPHLPDDLLSQCLGAFDGRPDFVLLDSGGHMGNVEFCYTIERLRGECLVALDDIRHVKHYRSFAQLQADPRFELLVQSPEKFGFCLARFTPTAGRAADDAT